MSSGPSTKTSSSREVTALQVQLENLRELRKEIQTDVNRQQNKPVDSHPTPIYKGAPRKSKGLTDL